MKIINLKELSKKFELMQKQQKEQTKLFTNIEKLNKTINGFSAGQLITLCARPGVGKTTLMCNFMLEMANWLKNDEYILFFTLEMSEYEIFSKLLKIEMAKNNLTADEALKTLSNKNILIFDNFEGLEVTPDLINKIIEELFIDNKKIKSVLIDYLQYLSFDGKYHNEQERLSNISNRLKHLAKNKKVSVFLLAQLKRTYDDKKETPTFSDIKGTGAIEQDSDIIMFLYDGELNIVNENKNKILEVAKNRNGEVKKINLLFNSREQLFYEK